MKKYYLNILDEMKKLVDEGFGAIVTKEEMTEDGVIPAKLCAAVYLKPEATFIDKKFFDMVVDKELTTDVYVANFNKSVDSNTRKIVQKYHPHKEYVFMSEASENSGDNLIQIQMTDC